MRCPVPAQRVSGRGSFLAFVRVAQAISLCYDRGIIRAFRRGQANDLLSQEPAALAPRRRERLHHLAAAWVFADGVCAVTAHDAGRKERSQEWLRYC